MREIKFRIYNKEEQTIEQVFAMDWSSNQIVISCNTQNSKYYSFQDENFPDNFKLMQFTGLKDKNGVEIYEGDIIKFDYANLQFNLKGSIALNEYNDSVLREPKKGDYHIEVATKGEVIGNIYEHKHLLEEL